MTTTQIRYFLEVAKEESFTKAAEKLFISHQVLSNQLKALEKELGLELIDRSNKRNIRLTDAGHVMFDAWTDMLEIHEKAFAQAEKLHSMEQRSLVIGIQDMRFVRSYVVPIIRQLQDDPEGFNLEYRLGTPMEMISMLESGQVDMLIMISSDIDPNTPYSKAVLCKEALHLVVAVAKTHPIAKKKKISMKDLEDETILMIGDSYSGAAAERFQKDLKHFKQAPKKIKSFNGPRAMNIAIETGIGVGLLFDELLEEARDEIVTFPIYLPNAEKTDMLLVWKEPKYKSIAERMIRIQRQEK